MVEIVGHTAVGGWQDSTAVPVPEGVQEGDLLRVWIAANDSPEVEAPSGWTLEVSDVGEDLGGNTAVYSYTRTATSDDEDAPTHTWDWPEGDHWRFAIMVALSAAAGVREYHLSANANTDSLDSEPLEAAPGDLLLVCGYNRHETEKTWSPEGLTEIASQPRGLVAAYEVPEEGPVQVYTLTAGEAGTMAVLTVLIESVEEIGEATFPPVSDMWIGPLGMMHRMQRRGTWERTPELGVDTHTSLHGLVTTSRVRQAARNTTLSWEHLEREDADALEEMTLVPARAESVIALIDPDAATGNLMLPEQSRGRPAVGRGGVSFDHLYAHTGGGDLALGLLSGVRNICVRDPEEGSEFRWLHSYYGERGWPVMPGWPVYLSVGLGNGTLANQSRLELVFLNWNGAVLETASGEVGSGRCEGDAPPNAVSVAPRMLVNQDVSGLRLVGAAWLSLAPQVHEVRPLGNGCPMYSVVEFSDTPYLPWRSASLEMLEVRSHAYR